jgi:hypothetical protein
MEAHSMAVDSEPPRKNRKARRKPPSPPIEPIGLSVAQAAAATSISRTVLYQDMEARKLKFYLIHTRRIIMPEDLKDYIRAHRPPPPKAA